MKQIRVLFLIGILTVALIGVGSAFNYTSAEEIELTMWSHTYKPWNDILESQIEEYEANHDVKISYSYIEHQQLQGKLQSAFKAGTAPDIMGLYSSWLKRYFDQDLIAIAPSWVEEDIDKNFIELTKEYKLDGQHLGYPQHFGMYSPAFNTTIYKESGIEPESLDTWSDVVDANEKITTRRGGRLAKTGFTLSRNSTEDIVLAFTTLLKSNGGQILTDSRDKAAFNSEAGKRALEVYKKLSPPEISQGTLIVEPYVTGQVGGIRAGIFDKGTIQESAPKIFENTLISDPFKGTDRRSTATYEWVWSVNKRSSEKKQKEAWRFLQYISAPQQYRELVKQLGFAPINKENVQLGSDWTTKITENAAKYGERWHAFSAEWPSISLAIGDYVKSVLAGDLGIEEGLDKAEEEVNKILS